MASAIARTPTGAAEEPRVLPRQSFLVGAFYRFIARRLVLVGVVLVFFLTFLAVFGRIIAPYDPIKQDLVNVLAPPSAAHVLGTDELGRDTLSRLLTGSTISLQVGIVAVLMASIPGVVIGVVVGYRGGWADSIVMRILDGFMAFPSLVLALTIVSVLGASVFNVMLAIAVTSFPHYGRLVRGQVLACREFDYILAIRSVGARDARIIFRHVLPNVISPVLVQASLGVGFAITAEAGLSFLGLGIQPPTPTWGTMIQVGFQYLEIAPWLVMAPGSMIFIAVLGFNLLGDGLREALDPHLRPVK
ncbi:MAG: ABC transporter permease [Chloroflexota bacterium]|nr:ABC transporter permease [Chloroflexota bacterium]MDE3193669.1 ABC transporter permease [Chloroflexota bacterium]